MFSPVFNLILGRQLAVDAGLDGSTASKFGLVAMMIPNVFGLVVTNVLARNQAASQRRTSDASRAAVAPLLESSPTSADGHTIIR